MTDTLNPPRARPIAVKYDKRGDPYWESRMTPPDNTFGLCMMVPTRIIPVIFVPGVMGSNLKGIGPAEGVDWTLDSSITMLPWIGRGAAKRKRTLTPTTMIVDDGGSVPEGTQQSAEELRRRGWGEVGAMSYAPFLVWLENALNDYENPQIGERVGLMGLDLGAILGETKPTRDQIGLTYRYRFPVHACGYNWLASNRDSALLLGNRIDAIRTRYKSEGKPCDKVVVVTHSMGGLVARHCSEVLGYRTKIFGIVHGVMPAIGAAAVYRRFKSGTEGPHLAAKVLGENAAEMTAVLSSAPGPLQLLPTSEYGNGWLKIKDGVQVHSLPKAGDPYGDIYIARGKWWSMCDDQLMNPLNTESDVKARQARVDMDWAGFKNLIENVVRPFHEGIQGKYHPTTHAFFGKGDKFKAYGEVTWSSSRGGPLDATLYRNRSFDGMNARQLRPDELQRETDGKPELETARSVEANYTDKRWFPTTRRTYYISEPDEDGDGTVPHRSGVAVKAFCQSFLQVKVGHEPAYNLEKGVDNLRACRFTLRAIVHIAQAVKQTALKYE